MLTRILLANNSQRLISAVDSNAELTWSLSLSLSRSLDCRENLPTTTLYPTKDADGNPLETEYGLCRFKDHQTVTIQVQRTAPGDDYVVHGNPMLVVSCFPDSSVSADPIK